MTRSMTGFGRERMLINGRDILVEIKSVNHRYNEIYSKITRAYSYLEEPLKKLIQENISRGKTEVTLSITDISSASSDVSVNAVLAKGYIEALRKANEELGLMDDLSLSRVMHFPDIYTVVRAEADVEKIWADVKQVVDAAVAKFVSMRETEGKKMKADVTSRLDKIENMVTDIEKAAPEMTKLYREKLFQKLTEILEDKQIDEQRILTEAAIFAEKTAIDEETVRLRSHISQFRDLIEKEDIVGRKLDFIVQEMNREANTIGSKVQSLEITGIVIEIKSEIEKIREQIQNIE